jgi:hypothetical protein
MNYQYLGVTTGRFYDNGRNRLIDGHFPWLQRTNGLAGADEAAQW